MKIQGYIVILLLLGLNLCATGTVAHAQSEGIPTQVMVRAVAHDAKIIGSNVGGARITIQDVASGEILAEGVQEGTTGDTRKLVIDPVERGAPIYDTQGAAGFLATIRLERPTVVDITAYAPLGTPHAMQRTTKRMLLVPGADVLGNGIVLELNGFTVELLDVPSEAVAVGTPLNVRAKVTMLCGCPTEPGGLWNADDIEVVARLVQGDDVVEEVALTYAGTPSTYGGEVTAPAAGTYTLEVLAMDAGEGNFGQVQRAVSFVR